MLLAGFEPRNADQYLKPCGQCKEVRTKKKKKKKTDFQAIHSMRVIKPKIPDK
jgi:hypothetical protein